MPDESTQVKVLLLPVTLSLKVAKKIPAVPTIIAPNTNGKRVPPVEGAAAAGDGFGVFGTLVFGKELVSQAHTIPGSAHSLAGRRKILLPPVELADIEVHSPGLKLSILLPELTLTSPKVGMTLVVPPLKPTKNDEDCLPSVSTFPFGVFNATITPAGAVMVMHPELKSPPISSSEVRMTKSVPAPISIRPILPTLTMAVPCLATLNQLPLKMV